MIANQNFKNETLETIIAEQLKPFVRKVDEEAYYAQEYLQELGKAGFFSSQHVPIHELLEKEAKLVEETATYCMTTAFNLWCHLAALTYVRNSKNAYLQDNLLPKLENGEVLGGTGLSNPMKYYAGLEKLHLKAKRTSEGYIVSGTLPAVSNLAESHWFGLVAEVNEKERIMAIVPCNAAGLKLKEKKHFLGLNGSATYACQFYDVLIPEQWVIAEDADSFVESIRSSFVYYQIPLGFGVTDASIDSIKHVRNRQNGSNRYLPIQPEELEKDLTNLRNRAKQIVKEQKDLQQAWMDIVNIRLDTVYLTTKAIHANMLHAGGAAYIKKSDPARRMRESYFLVNLSPTVRHLEKMVAEQGQ